MAQKVVLLQLILYGEHSVKESKLGQNRGIDTKNRLT